MKNKTFLVKFFHLYSFLFLFSSINREFLFFGMDLRYIMLILGVLLLLLSRHVKTKKDENPYSKKVNGIFYALAMLFGWCLISNISWLWNGLDIELTQMINQNILIINNLLAIFIYRRFRNYVDEQSVRKIIMFSCCILVVSFILTGMGLSLSQISGSDVRSMSVTSAIMEHSNIFGGNFRIAGYAEDANYASLFLVIGILSALQLKTKKLYKTLLVISFSIAFGFACSKTILIAIPISILYYLVVTTMKKKRKGNIDALNSTILAVLPTMSFIMPKLNSLSNLKTLSTRFKLWDISNEIFVRSPIIGNGISSSRSAINMHYHHDWYVHPHSNYWQLLAETGIIGIGLFIIAFLKRLSTEDSDLDKIAVIVLLLFALTYEVIQLQIIVCILYILPLSYHGKEQLHE